MPDLAGPFDGSTFSQGPYYRDRGPLEPSGVLGPPAASASAGDLGLTAAGFALSMGLGRAHVRGAAYERTGTAWTYTVPANTSALGPRRDLLVLRRNLVAKTVVPTYLQGTAAASPVDPALTLVEDGTYDLPLFRVQAPPSSGTPLVITDLRRWIVDGIPAPLVCALIQTATQSLASGATAWNDVLFTGAGSEVHDPSSMHDPATNTARVTVPAKGVYRITGGASFAGDARGDRGVRAAVNGAAPVPGSTVRVKASDAAPTSIALRESYVTLNAGDYVTLQVVQTVTATISTQVDAAAGEACTLNVELRQALP